MNAVTKDFATSAGHWYCPKTGEPRYTIIGKNGKERNTTIRDAREHGYVPSVTTIMRLAAAPGLVRWQIGNAVMSALTLTRNEGESDEDYINRILRDSEEQARKARERGTEIHASIEKWFSGTIPTDDKWLKWADEAGDAVADWVGHPRWDAERSFASPLGFGGKLDLSAPGFVVDFKTTEKPDAKLWPEHRMQLSAYRMGLGMPEARCAICYVLTTEPKAWVIEVSQEELQQGWEEFSALLAFWKARNRI